MTESLSVYLVPGSMLADYKIDRILGSGGFGVTYLASDIHLNRQVVIKENFPRLYATRDPQTSTVCPLSGILDDNFQKTLQRFLAEARMLANISHANIIEILTVFEANDTAYFVMPYIGEHNLSSYGFRESGKRMKEKQFRFLLKILLGALEYLHSQNIYHRDIKPDNILISSQGAPILIDFGCARSLEMAHTVTIMASLGFSAPEQMLGLTDHLGPWTDLYALGASVYYLLTGIIPQRGDMRQFRNELIPLISIDEIKEEYTPRFLNAIDRAIDPDWNKRFQSAKEWMEELALNQSHTAKTITRILPEKAILSPRSSLLKKIIFAGVLLFLCSAGGLYFFLSQSGKVQGNNAISHPSPPEVPGTLSSERNQQEEKVLETAQEFAGGKGTQEQPFLISSKDHLNNVRYHLDACYRMESDIVFTKDDFVAGGKFHNGGSAWIPIGGEQKDQDGYATGFFTGTFDGNGKTIYGLLSTPKQGGFAGLFGYIDQATCKNLSIIDVCCYVNSDEQKYVIKGISASTCFIAGCAAFAKKSTIRNVHIRGIVSTTSSRIALYVSGLIVGLMKDEGEISNCYVEGEVNGSGYSGPFVNNYFGGIAGTLENVCTIRNCYVNNLVVKPGPFQEGGIIAGHKSQNAVIRNCCVLNADFNTSNYWIPKYQAAITLNMQPKNTEQNYISSQMKYNGIPASDANDLPGIRPSLRKEVQWDQRSWERKGFHFGQSEEAPWVMVQGIPRFYWQGTTRFSSVTFSTDNKKRFPGEALESIAGNWKNPNLQGGGIQIFPNGIVNVYNNQNKQISYRLVFQKFRQWQIVPLKESGPAVDIECIEQSNPNLLSWNGNILKKVPLREWNQWIGLDASAFSGLWIHTKFRGCGIIITPDSFEQYDGFSTTSHNKKSFIELKGNVQATISPSGDSIVLEQNTQEIIINNREHFRKTTLEEWFKWMDPAGTAIRITPWAETSIFASPQSPNEAFAGGAGTPNDPFLISSKKQLNNIRFYPEAHYKITRDIVFSKTDFAPGGAFYNKGSGWIPIGEAPDSSQGDQSHIFCGSLDGNGKTIYGLISTPKNENVLAGLFGMSIHASFKNLALVDAHCAFDDANSQPIRSVMGSWKAFLAGCLVAKAFNCNIENVFVRGYTATHTAEQQRFRNTAGLIGGVIHDAKMTNCYAEGSVNGGYFVGGLVGDFSGAMINCYINDVTIRKDLPKNVGVLAGTFYKNSTIIENCCILQADLAIPGNLSDNSIFVSESIGNSKTGPCYLSPSISFNGTPIKAIEIEPDKAKMIHYEPVWNTQTSWEKKGFRFGKTETAPWTFTKGIPRFYWQNIDHLSNVPLESSEISDKKTVISWQNLIQNIDNENQLIRELKNNLNQTEVSRQEISFLLDLAKVRKSPALTCFFRARIHPDIALANQQLRLAIRGKDRNIVQKLLLEGCDINNGDDKGRTPLMEAAVQGDEIIVSLLLKHGADPSIKDRGGITARDWAQKRNMPHITSMLPSP